MEIGETGICHDLALAVINVEVDTEQDIIEFLRVTDTTRVIGSEVLLILPLETFNCLVLTSDTDIIEVVRGVSTSQIIHVEHGHRAIRDLLTVLCDIDRFFDTVIVDNSDS